MWVAKIKINGSEALLGSIAKLCSVSISGYPIHTYEKEDFIYVDFICFIFGLEENKEKFIKILKKSPRILNLEKEGNFIIGKIKESISHKSVYGYDLIHIEPFMIQEDGIEYWNLGSWSRDNIMKFVDATEKNPGSEILNIYQKKINNFTLLNVQPELTFKQRSAMDFAIRNGYYDYPRKTGIKKLANISKISYSTFQAHLRKAENKFLPFSFSKFY